MSSISKYFVAAPESIAAAADLINRHPDRFLFGTDEVAPKDHTYAPLLARLAPEVRGELLRGNHERLFDAARLEVRAWEKENPKGGAR